MFYNPTKKMIVFILIHMIFLASCATTYRTIDSESDALQGELRVGDTVRILTKSGKILTFEITAISETDIKGPNQQVPFNEIVKIEKQGKGMNPRVQKMLGRQALIIAFGVVLLGVVFLSWKSTCEDGSCQ